MDKRREWRAIAAGYRGRVIRSFENYRHAIERRTHESCTAERARMASVLHYRVIAN